MSIYLTITAAAGNEVQQSEVSANLSKSITVSAIQDTENGALNVDDFNFSWYFIDKPTGSSISIDESSSPANKSTVILNSIDTWGTTRIFVIATNNSNPTIKSEENPLKSDERNFINIVVKSTNNSLEKPAAFQRNWKEQYNSLVDVVDKTTKRVNKLKVSNTTTFTLPSTDGSNGQILTTNGAGLLSFNDLDLSNIENNISLNSLTDVNIVNPVDGYALIWNTDRWESGEISGGNNITGLTSDEATETLTISNGYSLIPDTSGFSTNDIGSITNSFSSVYAANLDISNSLLLNEVLYSGSDGLANTYLKTDGAGTTSFSSIQYSEISGAPTIETLIGGSPESGQFLKWDEASNSWSPGDVTLNLSVTQEAASGTGTLEYVNDTGTFNYTPPLLSSFIELTDLSVTQNAASGNGSLSYDNTSGEFTYIPPDLSNLGGGGGGGLTNWTENASGHIIPNSNATYDIGEAENKVRHLYLSENSLFIGDTSISLSTNDNIPSYNSNKSFKLGSSSIDLDSYKFSFSDTSPANISGGTTYRIKAIGSVDFTLVGAKFNQVGHIFTASTNGADAGLVDDGISFVSQSENYEKVSLFVERDTMNDQNIKLKYNASGESKELITVSGSIIDIPGETSLLTYSSGSWSSTALSSLEINKTITEKHSGEWSTVISYPDDPDNPGSKLDTFEASSGPSKFLFAIKNNTGSAMSIKKITLTCSEMYSSTIDWTAAKATDAEFITNVATKLFLMSSQRIEKTNENGGVGIGTVTFEDSNYNSISNDYWLVIAINEIVPGSNADKNFTVTLSYT